MRCFISVLSGSDLEPLSAHRHGTLRTQRRFSCVNSHPPLKVAAFELPPQAPEGFMHIHPSAIGLHPINTCSAGNERAAIAQRAAAVRRRLLKAAQSPAAATPEENLLIGQWLDSRHSQVLPPDEHDSASEGEDPDFA
jgi:hypothetical protein